MIYQDAAKAKKWLMHNGFWVHMIVRKKWLVVNSESKEELVFKTNAQLLAFANSKGWEPKGDADE